MQFKLCNNFSYLIFHQLTWHLPPKIGLSTDYLWLWESLTPHRQTCVVYCVRTQFWDPLWTETCKAQVTSPALVLLRGHPKAVSWGNAVPKVSAAPGSPGTGSFQVTRYLSGEMAQRLWGFISLSQHTLLIIITAALHIAWHPRPDLALLSASQLYTCSLPHSLQTMQLLGWLLKLYIMAERLFLSLEQSENLQAKKNPMAINQKPNPTIKWLLRGLNYFSPILAWVFAFFLVTGY